MIDWSLSRSPDLDLYLDTVMCHYLVIFSITRNDLLDD